MKSRRPVLILLIFSAVTTWLFPMSGKKDVWQIFLERSSTEGVYPQDEVMGPLYIQESSDAWMSGAVAACSRIISGINNGKIDKSLFLPVVKLPLDSAFGNVMTELQDVELSARYGLPWKEGIHVSVPLRLSDGSKAVYGNVYFMYVNGKFLLEQWEMDLSGFTGGKDNEKAG